MSRTLKDRPIHAVVETNLKSGVVMEVFHNHDFSGGRCVIGSRHEAQKQYKGWTAHRNSGDCSGMNYVKTCVHSSQRDDYQRDLDLANANLRRERYEKQRLIDACISLGFPPPGTFLVNEGHVFYHEERMLRAGFYPYCSETKTHEVDVRDVAPLFSQNHDMLEGTFEPERCDACSAYMDSSVTCYRQIDWDGKRDRNRSMSGGKRKEKRSRGAVRQKARQAVREYNSY